MKEEEDKRVIFLLYFNLFYQRPSRSASNKNHVSRLLTLHVHIYLLLVLDDRH